MNGTKRGRLCRNWERGDGFSCWLGGRAEDCETCEEFRIHNPLCMCERTMTCRVNGQSIDVDAAPCMGDKTCREKRAEWRAIADAVARGEREPWQDVVIPID